MKELKGNNKWKSEKKLVNENVISKILIYIIMIKRLNFDEVNVIVSVM